MIHRASVEQLIAESAAPDLGRHVERPEQRVTRFRGIYWFRDASSHGPANDILNAFQAQHDLPERFYAVREEIADLGRAVEAHAAQRIGAALEVLTIVGLPSGAALEILQALDANTWQDLAIGLAAAFAVNRL